MVLRAHEDAQLLEAGGAKDGAVASAQRHDNRRWGLVGVCVDYAKRVGSVECVGREGWGDGRRIHGLRRRVADWQMVTPHFMHRQRQLHEGMLPDPTTRTAIRINTLGGPITANALAVIDEGIDSDVVRPSGFYRCVCVCVCGCEDGACAVVKCVHNKPCAIEGSSCCP